MYARFGHAKLTMSVDSQTQNFYVFWFNGNRKFGNQITFSVRKRILKPLFHIVNTCKFIDFVTKIVRLIFADSNQLILLNCKCVVETLSALIVIPVTKENFNTLFDNVLFHILTRTNIIRAKLSAKLLYITEVL